MYKVAAKSLSMVVTFFIFQITLYPSYSKELYYV
jgi:hypothetical protein